MYRRSRWWNRILFRISVWVLLLGLVSNSVVSYFVKEQMRRNLEKQIVEDARNIQNNNELYVRQILLINNCHMDASGFRKCVYEIEEQLRNTGEYEIALYDMEGTMLKSSDEERFESAAAREDFQRAQNKESAFTVTYRRNGACEVYFTMPVKIMNQYIGMIGYYLDYADQYQREWSTIHSLLWIAVAAFVIIYLLIWVMIRQLVNPIRNLSRISSDISHRLKEGKIDGIEMQQFRYDKRKDEIGELTRNYMQMLRMTEDQFEKIQEDRDRILLLWNSRQEFYNNVTHELKTPLTTISGYAQLIEENGLKDEELFYNGMEHILQESTRLHRMVVQLLEMQNKENIDGMEQFDLTSLLSNVMDSMRMKAKRYENRLVLEGRGRYTIEGREDRVRQVFINLIDNAIKYGEPKTDIVICVSARDRQVQVTVGNEGEGISEEEIAHIFEPFYRVDKEHSRELGSSGLGLAITRKIMEEHGGSIEAECKPDGYTVFRVYFPMIREI